MTDYLTGLELIEDLLSKHEYSSCILECGMLIERGLRHNLKKLILELGNSKERQAILEAEMKHRKGNETIMKFGLGQLCGVMKEARAWKLLRRQLTSNMRRVRYISWSQVVEWRNAASHSLPNINIGEMEALQMYIWTKTFLIDCELVGEYLVVKPIEDTVSVANCPECKQKVKPQWKYCPLCGIGINLRCSNCKRQVSEKWGICPWCDAKLERQALKERDISKDEYKHLCKGVWLDGIVYPRERELLEKKRIELGLSCDEAQKIETECAPPKNLVYTQLVEAVLVDKQITPQEKTYLERKAKELGIDPRLKEQIENSLGANTASLQ